MRVDDCADSEITDALRSSDDDEIDGENNNNRPTCIYSREVDISDGNPDCISSLAFHIAFLKRDRQYPDYWINPAPLDSI
jgi:hypothetical protein